VNAKKVKVVTAILLALTAVQAVRADSLQSVVHQGNKLYTQGKFNEAIKKYDQALIDAPQALEPKFNKANSYFQLDDLARAIDLYRQVAADSKDMKLVAAAKYNLGNCYFQQGSRQKDSNLHKAIEDLQTGIVCWRGVLDIDSGNEKAAKNIEVARLVIKDIIDQVNKQKQQQQQHAAQQKQLQKRLKQLLERQKALAEQSRETKSQADKGQISRQQASDNYSNQAEEQSQLKDQTEQISQQIQQQDANSPQPLQTRQAAGELEQAAADQADAENQLKTSDGAAANKSQHKAIEHLENAMKTLSQKNPENQQQQQKQKQSQQGPNQPQQQKQQQQERKNQKKAVAADTTAQKILDKEQREKRQRQILQRTRYQKVEKDW